MNQEHAIKLLRGGPRGIREFNVRRDRGDPLPDFDGVNLTCARLCGVNFSQAELDNAILAGSNLERALLIGADLRNANLEGANLAGSSLRFAKLHQTVLYDTNLRDANLRGAMIMTNLCYNTNVTNAEFGEPVIACNLAGMVGLESIRHTSPSMVDVNSILTLQDDLPEVFLRGCGLRDEELEYFRSVVGLPIRFYTCFICYCTEDEAFASRLHNDFQNAGIRCWKWDHDARTGEELFGEIVLAHSSTGISGRYFVRDLAAATPRSR
jgi:hypothetical protein